MGSDPKDSTSLDRDRLRAARRESRTLRQTSQQAIARARAARYVARYGRSERQVLRDSAYARLLARQETMAAIEQAKGIIMAQQRCGPEEAFDLLRRASQRANVKVRALAAQIVEHVARGGDHGNVTPIALGAAPDLLGGRLQEQERAPKPISRLGEVARHRQHLGW